MDFRAARLDMVNFITTIALLVVIGVLAFVPVIIYAFLPYKSMPWMWVPSAFVAVLLLIAAGFSPRGYKVTDTELLVRRRLFGVKRYKLEGFEKVVGLVGRYYLGQKLTGSSGFLGYFGTFHLKELGSFEAQATNAHEALVLVGARPLVVSPAERELFKDIVNARLKAIQMNKGHL